VRALQARLAAHGVSFGHWTFLRILWERDGLTQRELSDQAGVMEPTTGAAIRAMEKLGYVARRRNPRNRKNVYVHLTRKGRALKAKLVPLAVDDDGPMVYSEGYPARKAKPGETWDPVKKIGADGTMGIDPALGRTFYIGAAYEF
jgi:DNA-binding MarR family transcriptional regulator